MDGVPPGNRGLVGFPVALALQAIGWKSDGTFEIGFSTHNPPDTVGNLFFDGLNPVTRVKFAGRELDFIPDTGNQAGTELWHRFANDFPGLVNWTDVPRPDRPEFTRVLGSVLAHSESSSDSLHTPMHAWRVWSLVCKQYGKLYCKYSSPIC